MKNNKTVFILFALLLGLHTIVACSPSAYEQEAAQVETAQDQLNKNQPIHKYDYSPERDLFQRFFDARMEGMTTYNYRIDNRDGFPTWSCIGYGMPIPYSTQLSNPMARVYSRYGTVTLPQPEPNGLYTPNDASATLVPCIDLNGNVSPVYEEQDISSYFSPQCFEEKQRADGSWTGKYQQTSCGESSYSYTAGSE